MRIATFVIAIFVSFSAGLLLAKRQPQTIYFKQAQIVIQEVRDASFKRCSTDRMNVRSDGTMEQLYTCSKGQKLFLVKKVVHQARETR